MSRYSGLEQHYARRLKKVPPTAHLNIDQTKATIYGNPIEDVLREAMKDVNPIDEMVTLMRQRYDIEQSIKKLLPKMTKDEIAEVYHTLYRIAQKITERESNQ